MEMTCIVKKTPKQGSKVSLILLLIFFALFCLSAYKVTSQLVTERAEKQAFAELLAQVDGERRSGQRVDTPEPAVAEEPTPTGEGLPADEPAPGEDAEVASLPAPDANPTEKPSAQGGAPAEAEPAVTGGPEGAIAAETPFADDTAREHAEATVMPTPVPTPVPTPTEVPPMLASYASLYKQNHHLFGWIEIEGTAVNFPVMYTPWNSEYYLHKKFDGTYSFSGVPFLDGDCYLGCGNYLIYGHHMKNGTMFADVVNYASVEYWQEHPTILFDTLYELGTYEVIAAFYSRVYTGEDENVFRYYQYQDLSEQDVFEDYVAQVKAAAIYDTGIEAAYGDQLLTLSTCEYSAKDGRFVVVARKTEP